MNTDRRLTLALIAMARMTPAEATTAGSVGRKPISLVMVWLAQVNVDSLALALMHFFNAQAPALAKADVRRSRRSRDQSLILCR